MKIKLNKKTKYLLACSYGPDSMFLCNYLLKNGFNFAVANVNYNLRNESKSEQHNLKKFCNKNNIQFFGFNVKENISRNIEEKCREIRYTFFKKIYSKYCFQALLVAHNLDDLLETYILQKNRGGIVEFYGLKYETFLLGMRVLRPLLRFEKSKLKESNDSLGVPYCIDKSNFENKYERNKIRHNIIENMTSKQKKMMLKSINKENKELKRRHSKLEKNPFLNVNDIAKLENDDFAYLITFQARKLIPSFELSKNRAAEIKKALCSKKPNINLNLEDDVYLFKAYDQISIKRLQENKDYSFVIKKPCELDTPYFYLNFIKGSSDRLISEDDYPLTIRNGKKTDKICIKNYQTSLRRAFIDWKMPVELREKWPVIEDKNHKIIYVPRYKKKFHISSDLNFYVKL